MFPNATISPKNHLSLLVKMPTFQNSKCNTKLQLHLIYQDAQIGIQPGINKLMNINELMQHK